MIAFFLSFLFAIGCLYAEQQDLPSQLSTVLSHKDYIDLMENGRTEQRKSYFPGGGLKKIESVLSSNRQESILHGLYEEYFPNGSLKLRGEMYFGKLQGKWSSLSEEGIKAEGYYSNGLKTGEWVSTSSAGNILLSEQYTSGILSGPRTQFFPSGGKASEEFYSNGLLHGLSTHYYENGSKKSEKNWFRGLSHGINRKWNNNGLLLEEGSFVMGTPAGVWNWYDLDGKTIRTSDWSGGEGLFYKTAVVKASSADDSDAKKVVIVSEKPYVNGMMEGIQKEYYENGILRSAISYKEGKKDGAFQQWRSNGTLAIEGEYRQDLLFGTIKEYYDPHHILAEKPHLAVQTVYLEPGIIAEKTDYNDAGIPILVYQLQDNIGIVKRLHESGLLLEQGTVHHGRREGLWKEFYLDGSEKSSVFYVQGQEHGEAIHWYPMHEEKQIKRSQGHFSGGKKEGYWKEWSPKGTLISTQEFVQGVEHGTFTVYWNASAKKKEEGRYYFGDREGLWTAWYENGQLHNRTSYKKNLPEGDYEEYHPLAEPLQLKVKGTFVKGKPSNEWRTFFTNGQLQISQNYREGRLEGVVEEWFDNRQLKNSTTYLDGEKHGKASYYNKEGQLISCLPYDHGLLHGSFELFSHPNGALSTRGSYKKGIPDAKWEWFALDGKTVVAASNFENGTGTLYSLSPQGKIQQSIDYAEGLESGYLKIWNEKEVLMLESAYSHGLLHGLSRHFDQDGHIVTESNWIYGRRSGPYLSRYPNGQNHISANFQEDLLEGEACEFTSEGICRWRGHWQNGKRDGTWTWYDDQGKALMELLFDDGIVLSTTPAKSGSSLQ